MPHSPEVAAALEASIEHWRENRERTDPNKVCTGSDECALCHLFNNSYTGDMDTDCLGCPVRGRTGQPYCWTSPHDKTVAAIIRWCEIPESNERRDAFRASCDEEIAFLESLRDAPEKSGA